MSRKKATAEFGWSVLIDHGEIGAKPYHKVLEAKEADLKAIAERLGIPAVDSLTAEMTLQRIPGNRAVVHLEGQLKAQVVQSCVISSAPVKAYIEEEFEAWYADHDSFVSLTRARQERAGKMADNEVPVIDEREDPEPMINGKIDAGDLVAQYLSLSLDPYPRAHGVSWEKDSVDTAFDAADAPVLRKNPFAALKDWKAGTKDQGDKS